MNTNKRTCFASVVNISEIKQSEIYLTIKARIFEVPGANLNGVRVTAAFLDELVANQEEYVCVPLYADYKNLVTKNYERLGHMYDYSTGEFHSTQIGSFYKYEKEPTENGYALIAYARIMKREKAVCEAITELFVRNMLKFSFEINCGSCEELDDGTIQIDANPDNYFEGAAVVSFPACENAVAMQLVAEHNADDEKDVIAMNKEVMMTDEVVAEEIQEQTEPSDPVVVAEEVVAEEVVSEETATEEIAETETAETEVAKCDKEKAADEESEDEETEEEEPEEDLASCDDKPEEFDAKAAIETLTASVGEMMSMIAELKKTIAEANAIEEVAPINPIVAEIKIDENKYSLLESDNSDKHYSLLDRA